MSKEALQERLRATPWLTQCGFTCSAAPKGGYKCSVKRGCRRTVAIAAAATAIESASLVRNLELCSCQTSVSSHTTVMNLGIGPSLDPPLSLSHTRIILARAMWQMRVWRKAFEYMRHV